jgi:hypothetical protein
VVLAFLAVAVVLSAGLILVPLVARSLSRRQQADEKAGTAGDRVPAWVPLGYFFLLGLGFLWIELPLMQRFILLLDHPVYSFAVVLFAVLVFSGIGSAFSERLGQHRHRVLLALGVLAIVYAAGIERLVDLILGMPLGARMVLAVLTTAPVAILMGTAFPNGIEALRQRRVDLVPWAWGVNGYASVIGSILATLIALNQGFSVVMLAAGITYLGAWALYRFGLTARR